MELRKELRVCWVLSEICEETVVLSTDGCGTVFPIRIKPFGDNEIGNGRRKGKRKDEGGRRRRRRRQGGVRGKRREKGEEKRSRRRKSMSKKKGGEKNKEEEEEEEEEEERKGEYEKQKEHRTGLKDERDINGVYITDGYIEITGAVTLDGYSERSGFNLKGEKMRREKAKKER